jgi:multidrug resistance efflux pump
MRKLRPLILVTTLAFVLAMAGCAAKASDPSGQTPAPQGAPGATPGTAAAAKGGAPQGAQGQGNGRRFATIPVQAVTVQSGTLVTENATSGSVVAVTQSPVAAQVAGVVARVARNAGDWVKQGALVIQLDDSAVKLAVKNAQASLENAKINLSIAQQTSTESNPKLASQLDSAKTALSAAQKNYDSQKKLFDLGGISSSQLDSSQSQLQQAQANVLTAQLALDQNQQAGTQTLAQQQLAVDQAATQLEIAQLNLRNTSITAPFAGQIAAVNVTPGMAVSLNTSVYVLVSAERQINFTVPPSDAPDFKIGNLVQFTFAGHDYPVRIIQSPSAPINGVVPLVAELPKQVPVSYGAVGTITYKLNIATGILIPIAALVTRADQNLVYSIVNGKAVEQPITIVAESGTTAVVKGLEAGMQIIVSPPPGLLAGSTVQAVTVSAQGQAPGGAPAPGAPGSGGQKGSGQQGGAPRAGAPGSGGQGTGGPGSRTGGQGSGTTQAPPAQGGSS